LLLKFLIKEISLSSVYEVYSGRGSRNWQCLSQS